MKRPLARAAQIASSPATRVEQPVDLNDKVVLRRLAENDAQQVVVGAFQQVIRDLSIEEREATIELPVTAHVAVSLRGAGLTLGYAGVRPHLPMTSSGQKQDCDRGRP
jgi:hypothetical protein